MARKAAVHEVVDLLGAHAADGGAVVAGHVVLVAEDDGHGLVHDVVAEHEHVLGLVALGASRAVHEVDGGAQGLLGRVVEGAGLADLGAGVLAAHAHHVVDVEHLGAAGVVAAAEVDAGAGAGEVAGEAHGHGAAAERVLAHLDAGVLVGADAHALEMLLGIAHAQDLDDGDLRAGLGHDAQERRGGCGGVAGGPVDLGRIYALGDRCALLAAVDRHDDRRGRALADHDAGVGHGARVGVDVHHDGLLAHGVARDLDVAGIGGLGADPVGDLLAHTALELAEELRQREVDVALAGEARHGEGYVVGAQAVPGLRGRGVHALERDGRRGPGHAGPGGARRGDGASVLLVSH